jgi:hypothetical protein
LYLFKILHRPEVFYHTHTRGRVTNLVFDAVAAAWALGLIGLVSALEFSIAFVSSERIAFGAVVAGNHSFWAGAAFSGNWECGLFCQDCNTSFNLLKHMHKIYDNITSLALAALVWWSHKFETLK